MVAALLPALLAAVPCAGRPASEAAVALQRAVDAAAEGGTVEVDAPAVDHMSFWRRL